MGYEQLRYEEFYDLVRKELATLITKKTGVEQYYFSPGRTMECPSSVTISPEKNDSYFKGNNHSSYWEPVEETISLSEEIYGDFIDTTFKEQYKSIRDSVSMKTTLAQNIAMAIYTVFLDGKKRLPTISNKVFKYGLEALSTEEKEIYKWRKFI